MSGYHKTNVVGRGIEVPSELLGGLEIVFYADPKECLLKALESKQ